MLLLSQALMAEQQKPFHPFSLVSHGGGRRRSGRWVFHCGMDVYACVRVCTCAGSLRSNLIYPLAGKWSIPEAIKEVRIQYKSVYNAAFTEKRFECDSGIFRHIRGRRQVVSLETTRFQMQFWRPPASSLRYSHWSFTCCWSRSPAVN